MKNIIPILLTFVFLLGTAGESFALPKCKGSPRVISDYKEVASWGECNGAVTFGSGGGTRAGNKYNGDWKDGVINGHGTYTWADGNKYVGDWKGQLRHGQGTFTSPNGEKRR